MLGSIWQDIRQEFSSGNTVTRIIIINVVFFIAINLLKLFLLLFNGWNYESMNELFASISHAFMISSDWTYNLTHPWNVFTHMFLHIGFFHILWNMLIFYWFGRILSEDLIGDDRVLPIYLVSGLGGGLAYFLAANFLMDTGVDRSFALGASAAVMGVAIATATISPNYEMRLLFFGNIKVKYIVGVLLLLDLIGVANTPNAGGPFGHLGGALLGWIFVQRLNSGSDWSIPINNILNRLSDFFGAIFSRRPNLRAEKNPDKSFKPGGSSKKSSDPTHQEKIDAILDKIKKSGYDSLTKEEKEFLFRASKK